MLKPLLLAAVALAAPALAHADVISDVHARVDRAITYEDQRSNANWRVMPAKGDCKDFAASYLHELVAAGVDPERLQIWLVHSAAADPHTVYNHAVLVIDGVRVLQEGRDTGWDRSLARARIPAPLCTRAVLAGNAQAAATCRDATVQGR